jgi:hypothetical protein
MHDVSVTHCHTPVPFGPAKQKHPPTEHCAKHGTREMVWHGSPELVNVEHKSNASAVAASADVPVSGESSLEHAPSAPAPIAAIDITQTAAHDQPPTPKRSPRPFMGESLASLAPRATSADCLAAAHRGG